MKKKIGVLISIVVVIAGIVIFISQLKQKPVISSTLSSRSKEYLKEKNTIANSSLKQIVVDDPQAVKKGGDTITGGDCFKITIPFVLRSVEQKKPCYVYLAIENPRGRITMYQEDGKIGEPEQIPGLSMRRIKTDLYKEEDKTYNGRTFYIFKRLDESYEKTVFSSTASTYFILTITAATSEEEADAKLYTMLESITFIK